MGLGYLLHRIFKFPSWTIAAICFNNTTALPLLLVQSLDSAGILSDLLMGPDDSPSAAVKRAKSYFLVSAMVGNSLTFAVGPKLLDDEEAPDKHNDKKHEAESNDHTPNGTTGNPVDDVEQAHHRRAQAEEAEHENPRNTSGRTAEEEESHDNETTSLLPASIAHHATHYREHISQQGTHYFNQLPQRIQTLLSFLDGFLNAPLIGAVMGALLGLVPGLHRLFFNAPDEGGYFKAWLTESIGNVGELFPALQLVVVGAKLGGSLLKMKKGEASGHVPWGPMMTVFLVRFVLWPV